MRRNRILAGLALAVLLAGCSSAGGDGPRAVVPETEVDFGDVPVLTDMSDARRKVFTIRNEGTKTLKLLDGDIKVLEGC